MMRACHYNPLVRLRNRLPQCCILVVSTAVPWQTCLQRPTDWYPDPQTHWLKLNKNRKEERSLLARRMGVIWCRWLTSMLASPNKCSPRRAAIPKLQAIRRAEFHPQFNKWLLIWVAVGDQPKLDSFCRHLQMVMAILALLIRREIMPLRSKKTTRWNFWVISIGKWKILRGVLLTKISKFTAYPPVPKRLTSLILAKRTLKVN